MSSRYIVQQEAEALTKFRKLEQKEQIKQTIGTEISAKYKEFILLQYQLHCDEYDVCQIVIADNKNQHIAQAESFLLHCQERGDYCLNEIKLLGKAFPEMSKARFASQQGRI